MYSFWKSKDIFKSDKPLRGTETAEPCSSLNEEVLICIALSFIAGVILGSLFGKDRFRHSSSARCRHRERAVLSSTIKDEDRDRDNITSLRSVTNNKTSASSKMKKSKKQVKNDVAATSRKKTVWFFKTMAPEPKPPATAKVALGAESAVMHNPCEDSCCLAITQSGHKSTHLSFCSSCAHKYCHCPQNCSIVHTGMKQSQYHLIRELIDLVELKRNPMFRQRPGTKAPDPGGDQEFIKHEPSIKTRVSSTPLAGNEDCQAISKVQTYQKSNFSGQRKQLKTVPQTQRGGHRGTQNVLQDIFCSDCEADLVDQLEPNKCLYDENEITENEMMRWRQLANEGQIPDSISDTELSKQDHFRGNGVVSQGQDLELNKSEHCAFKDACRKITQLFPNRMNSFEKCNQMINNN